ncbi:MAG: SDR family NAD(P)-dependent oxidoreductase [Rhodobacterales bacterium]|nr:SDR family NAD(P)-dependent oxidoreductase [Rhodobacterales bacterium]
MDFTDRHVVVTGGTGALGTAVTGRLLDLGATCHIPNLQADELTRFPHAGHDRVRVTPGVDLTDAPAVDAFYGTLPSLWASIHLAGGFDMASLAHTSAEAFTGQMTMNATTCFLCCRAAAGAIRASGGGGRIVNVAARPGLEPRQGAGMAAYAASKAAVAALTQALGEELAAEGIWVNAVAPSILDTPANRAAMPDADHDAWPKVSAVAEAIVFLASPENGAGRGGVLPVYGRV